MVTLKEIAKECKVSPATVSNILNGKPKVSEETRQRVLEAVDKLDYRPNYMAQGLRNRKTKTIGIIAEDIAQFTTPEIVDGIIYIAGHARVIRCFPKGFKTPAVMARELLKTDVTAIFCMSDRQAGGVYRCLDEMGLRAGKDIAVAGFDDQDIAEYLVPGLTTMALPLREIGNMSAGFLLKQMDDTEEKMPEKVLIPCTFMERESVHQIK